MGSGARRRPGWLGEAGGQQGHGETECEPASHGLIGSSREVVSRLLKELLDSELLEAEGKIIRVSESALILREE